MKMAEKVAEVSTHTLNIDASFLFEGKLQIESCLAKTVSNNQFSAFLELRSYFYTASTAANRSLQRMYIIFCSSIHLCLASEVLK